LICSFRRHPLLKRDPALAHRVFDRVVDSGRVPRTLFQMVRSGQFGRKSLPVPPSGRSSGG
jgi:hypothetical protein